MEVPADATSMLDSPNIRKRTSGQTSAPTSPSRTSRPSSPLQAVTQVRPNLVKQPSSSVILLPDASMLAPDIGAGVTNEGNVAPEREVHHAGADLSTSDIEIGRAHV